MMMAADEHRGTRQRDMKGGVRVGGRDSRDSLGGWKYVYILEYCIYSMILYGLYQNTHDNNCNQTQIQGINMLLVS